VVARLVFDAIWRSRWIYVVIGVLLIPFWLLFGLSRGNPLPIGIMAVSLIAASMLGPMFAIQTMGLRELRHWPVTNRDLWRATWVVATFATAGFLLATKTMSMLLVAAFGGSPKVSVEAVMLSAVYDFTWAGVMLLVLAMSEYGGGRLGTLAGSAAATKSIVVALACFGLPMLMSGALPTDVGEFTSRTLGGLIAGLAIAFGAIAWTPRRGVLAGERSRAQRTVTFPGAATRTRLADHLTGISRVVVPHALATVALPVGACLALAASGVISGAGPWWFVPQTPSVFDPADTGDRGLTYFVLLPCAVATMMGLWAPWARLLRVLPLSVRQVNALLLLTPFATWTILWALGWSAYVLAYGTPRTLRIEFAFGMAGIGALAHAAFLRFQGSAGTLWVMAFSGALMLQLVKIGLRDGTTAQIAFALLGAIALCAAAFVNHRTLTRSTSSSPAYQRPQPPFAIAPTPGMR
jgi:hypothetical protein